VTNRDIDHQMRLELMTQIRHFLKHKKVSLIHIEKTTGIWKSLLDQYLMNTRKPPIDVCRDILNNLREQVCTKYRQDSQYLRQGKPKPKHRCRRCYPKGATKAQPKKRKKRVPMCVSPKKATTGTSAKRDYKHYNLNLLRHP